MTRRRHGFTLLELLFAAAVLAVSLLAAYTYLWRGFENGVDLLRRDMADSIARTVIERYARQPFGDLEDGFRTGTRDVLDEDDEVLLAGLPHSPEVLKRMGFRVMLGFERVPGEFPSAILETRVSWPLPGGKRRSLAYGRSVVSDGTPPAMAATASKGARGEAPSDWGSAREWRPDPKPARRPPPTGEAVARRRAFEGRHQVTAASREVARSASISYAEAARAVAAAYRPTSDGRPGAPALGFEGAAALTTRLLGPQGQLSAKIGDPAKVREARATRQRARFLARSGARLEPWLADDIPDGDYAYHLEGQDLRDPEGLGRVVGVYVLRAAGDTYHLVRDVDFSPYASSGSLEGDPAVRVASYQDAAGRPVTLRSTETRLYFLRPGRASQAWIRTLAAPDTTLEGEAWTRRQLDELEARLGLTPVEPRSPRADDLELVEAAHPEVRWAGASGCDTGTCKVAPPRVEDRPRLEPPRAPAVAPSVGAARSAPAMIAAAPSHGRTRSVAALAADAGADEVDAAVRDLESLAFTDPEGAIRALDDVLMQDPDHGPARALRGRLFALRGNEDQATEDLRAARRDPRVAEGVLPDLAGLLLRADQVDEAERLIEQFRAARPDDPSGQALAMAVHDRREFLAQVAPPVGGTGTGGPGGGGAPGGPGGAAPGGATPGGTAPGPGGIPGGWSGWKWEGARNSGSVMFRPSEL